MEYTVKETKKRIKTEYNNVLKMSDKEFFELKRKLFKDSISKKKYTIDDIQKLVFAKMMIDIGLMPQKAVNFIEDKWDKKISLIDYMIEIANKNIGHLNDILVLLESMKLYEENEIKFPIINVDGMGEYGERVSNELYKLFEKAEKNIEEEIFTDQLFELLKKSIELKNENVLYGTIKANAYVLEIEKVLCKALGYDIKKFMVSLYFFLKNKEIKSEINNLAKAFDKDDDNEFDYAGYIGTLIFMKYYKELSVRMYLAVNKIIDCETNIIDNENVKTHIIKNNEEIKKCKKEVIDLLNDYYPIFDNETDFPIVLNSIYNSTQTLFYIDLEGTEIEKNFLEEIKIYSKLILVVKTIFESE